jgi:hypothetical protein
MVQHKRKTEQAWYNTSIKQKQAWYNTNVKQNKHGTTQTQEIDQTRYNKRHKKQHT